MQPLTEQTARELLLAMQELTAAIRGGGAVHQIAPPPVRRQVDPAYLPGGTQWAIMASPEEQRQYKRNLIRKRRKEGRK